MTNVHPTGYLLIAVGVQCLLKPGAPNLTSDNEHRKIRALGDDVGITVNSGTQVLVNETGEWGCCYRHAGGSVVPNRAPEEQVAEVVALIRANRPEVGRSDPWIMHP